MSSLATQASRQCLRDHRENPVLTFLFSQRREASPRGAENNFPTVLPVCFLAHGWRPSVTLLPITFSRPQGGVMWSFLLCSRRVVSGESSAAVWRAFCPVTWRRWRTKANHPQRFPVRAWLPHGSEAAKPGEACLQSSRGQYKEIRLILFSSSCPTTNIPGKDKLLWLYLKYVLHLEQWFSFNVNCLFIIPFYNVAE